MTSEEKRNYVIQNKGSMSIKSMAAALNISDSMVRYFAYRYKKPMKRGPKKGINLKPVLVTKLKKVISDKDFSTNGFFDTNKWAKCLPV